MKNLKTYVITLVLFLGVFLLFWSCTEDAFNPQKENVSSKYKVPSIKKAQSNFKHITYKNNPFKGNSSQLAKDGDSIIVNWGASEVSKLSNETNIEILYTPVLYDDHGIRMKTFLASVTSEQSIETEIFTLFFDDTSNMEQFTGIIFNHYATGEFKKAYKYINGVKEFESLENGEQANASTSLLGNNYFRMAAVIPWSFSTFAMAEQSDDDCGYSLGELLQMVWDYGVDYNFDVVWLATVSSNDEDSNPHDHMTAPNTSFNGWNGLNSTYSAGSTDLGSGGAGPNPIDPPNNELDIPWWQKCPPGYEKDANNECVKQPCEGDPVANPEIAPQTVSGTQGGMYGCTRFGGSCVGGSGGKDKQHNAVDLKNKYGDPIFAMYDGVIYNTLHRPETLGYFTQIQSTINGVTIISLYAHLQEENRVRENSDGTLRYVKAGDIIGYQGNTGNLKDAIEEGKGESHIHIEIREHNGSSSWDPDNYILTNPLPYLGTTINANGTVEENDCN